MAKCTLCGNPNATSTARLETGRTQTITGRGRLQTYYHSKNKIVCDSCKNKISIDGIIFLSLLIAFPILLVKTEFGFWKILLGCIGFYSISKLVIKNI
jgi:hypothetical protein